MNAKRISDLSPIQVSLLLHSSFLLLLVIFSFNPSFKFKQKIDFEVIEYPKAAVSTTLNVNPAKAMATPPPETKRAVFGASRKSITTTSDEAATIKAGNTVAKEQDDLTLEKDDADSLPIPADDFLVTAMPALVKEFRIPYPPEAKAKGVEGPVVMDLLVDADGKVRDVTLIKGPGFGLNEAAVAAIKQFEFRPAKISDQNVAVKIRYTYRFVLENR